MKKELKMKTSKNKIAQVANFLEELSWVLESNKSPSLTDISEILREIKSNDNSIKVNIVNHKDRNYLVGILPKLLQNNKLFKSNSEMLDFAEDVLNLKPSRASKRSRIEYIGWIVCEVANSNNSKLNSLYDYLDSIISDENKIKKIREAKKLPNFSWNEAIRNISY